MTIWTYSSRLCFSLSRSLETVPGPGWSPQLVLITSCCDPSPSGWFENLPSGDFSPLKQSHASCRKQPTSFSHVCRYSRLPSKVQRTEKHSRTDEAEIGGTKLSPTLNMRDAMNLPSLSTLTLEGLHAVVHTASLGGQTPQNHGKAPEQSLGPEARTRTCTKLSSKSLVWYTPNARPQHFARILSGPDNWLEITPALIEHTLAAYACPFCFKSTIV